MGIAGLKPLELRVRRVLETDPQEVVSEGLGSQCLQFVTEVAAATPAGVVRIAFESEPAERVLEELEVRLGARVATTAAGLDDARRQLDDYFAGRRRSFTFTLDWALTSGFRRRILTSTAEIPFGATSTYRTLATVRSRTRKSSPS